MFICADAVFAAYEEPELEITSQPDYIVVGQTAEIKLEIIHPIDGVLYNGSFKIKGTKTGTQTFSGKKVTINYHLYFPNGGWHWKSATFTPEVTLDVVGIKSITVSKKVGLVGKECTVTGQTEPAGYEDLIEWEAKGSNRSIYYSGIGNVFTFSPNIPGEYLIKDKIKQSQATSQYIAVEAKFKLLGVFEKETYVDKTKIGNLDYPNERYRKYIINTFPMGACGSCEGDGFVNAKLNYDLTANEDVILSSVINILPSLLFIQNPSLSMILTTIATFIKFSPEATITLLSITEGDFIYIKQYGPLSISSNKGNINFGTYNLINRSNSLIGETECESKFEKTLPVDNILQIRNKTTIKFTSKPDYRFAWSTINKLTFYPVESDFNSYHINP
ncbi:MAG TPA: hypothetical protein PLD27_12655 [bacterium]|nr:hypothetical protein [bacterium]